MEKNCLNKLFSQSLVLLCGDSTLAVLRIRNRDPVLFYPRIRDGAMVGSGSGAFLPPGFGIRIRDGAMVGSGIKHPGSATLNPGINTGIYDYTCVGIDNFIIVRYR
jgi:hypothetical protein